MNIHWITSFEYFDGAILYYGTDDNATIQATGGMSHKLDNVYVTRYIHSFQLTGLEPKTKYFFLVGGDERKKQLQIPLKSNCGI